MLKYCLLATLLFLSKNVNGHDLDEYYEPTTPQPVHVNVSMYIIDLKLINPDTMDFEIDFYFRQRWIDSNITEDSLKQRTFWRPDTFITEGDKMDNSLKLSNSMVSLYGDQIFISQRITTNINCGTSKLRYFPADKPKCKLSFESYSYSANVIQYKWVNTSRVDKPSVQGFEVIDLNFDDEMLQISTGKYSRILLEINMKRNCGYYTLVIYLPAVLLVVLSWMQFCIDPIECSYHRISVGVFTSLASMLLFVLSIGTILPHHNIVRAVDVYLFVSMLMTLIAFVVGSHRRCTSKGVQSGSKCRLILPLIYIVFNVVYCVTLWQTNK